MKREKFLPVVMTVLVSCGLFGAYLIMNAWAVFNYDAIPNAWAQDQTYARSTGYYWACVENYHVGNAWTGITDSIVNGNLKYKTFWVMITTCPYVYSVAHYIEWTNPGSNYYIRTNVEHSLPPNGLLNRKSHTAYHNYY